MSLASTGPRIVQTDEMGNELGQPGRRYQDTDVPIRNGAFAPSNFEGMLRVANLMLASGMVPQGVNDLPQMVVVLAAGMEIGLSPMQSVQNIMIVNNRPTVFGDAAKAVVMATKEVEDFAEGFEGNNDDFAAVCSIKRRGIATPIVQRFSVKDARAAKLWGKPGPWTQYSKRMLQMRARSFALRDAFPDALKGINVREEIEDIEPTGPSMPPAPEAPKSRAASVAAAITQAAPAAATGSPPAQTPEPEPEADKPADVQAPSADVSHADVEAALGGPAPEPTPPAATRRGNGRKSF